MSMDQNQIDALGALIASKAQPAAMTAMTEQEAIRVLREALDACLGMLERADTSEGWCCGGCGSGIVKAPKRTDFEYLREEFPDGRVISKTIPQYVAPCCGGELLLWDEAKQDCVPWSYVDRPSQEADDSQKGGRR